MITSASKRFVVGVSAVACLSLVGHPAESKPMDAGKRISARGEAITLRGEAWTDGQHELTKGEKLVARSNDRTVDSEKKLRQAHEAVTRAEHQLELARSNRARGEQMIYDGTARMAAAEAAYAAIRSGPPAVEAR